MARTNGIADLATRPLSIPAVAERGGTEPLVRREHREGVEEQRARLEWDGAEVSGPWRQLGPRVARRTRLRASLNAPEPHGLVGRISERKLGQWMLAYLALAWMGLQITDALREIWGWPLGLQRGITLALALGILPASVIAWYHGEKGRQKVCFLEVTLITALILVGTWVIRVLTFDSTAAKIERR